LQVEAWRLPAQAKIQPAFDENVRAAMPIEYRIHHRQRLVVARGSGTVTDQDVFGYQRKAWSDPSIVGYDELVDMTKVQGFAIPSVGRVQELADLSAAMDHRVSESKFAIVAPNDLAYGLGRMYETYRAINPASSKKVSVFRTLPEALNHLGIEELPPWEDA